MWSPERPVWHVALLEDRLVIGRAAPPWSMRRPDVQVLPVEPAATDGLAPWAPAVAALSAWLGAQKGARARLHIVLSACFVRWQLLAWPSQLSRPDEVAAYTAVRFRETYGSAVDGWKLLHADPTPGQAFPGCAVDTALLEALQGLGAVSGTQIAQVMPYFSAAFDRWRGRVGRKTAWLGVVEPGYLTLALLHRGGWQGLRSVRHEGLSAAGWQGVLSALQTQMSVASGLAFAQEPALFLAGCSGAPLAPSDQGFTWLAPGSAREAGAGLDRMAWGV